MIGDFLNSFKSHSADKFKMLGSGINKKAEQFEAWFSEPGDNSLAKLKLDIIGNETIIAQSDVTDYYVEENTAYQNHISKKPLVYVIEGEVGEVSYYSKDEDNSVVGAVANKLTPITTFLPSVSKKMYSVMDKTTKALNLLDSIDNYVNRYIKLGEKQEKQFSNMQQKEFYWLIRMWEARLPINIKTPWRKLSNYVITNLEFNQSRRTKDVTNIKISFKEFRTVKRGSEAADLKKLRGRVDIQKSAGIDLGSTTGEAMTKGMCKLGQWCPTIDSTGTFW